MKDVRVEFKFKNAILLHRLEERFGIEMSAPKMAEVIGIDYGSLCYLLSLSRSPFVPTRGTEINGIRYSKTAMKIANFLDYADPAELFPVSLYSIRFPKKYFKEFESIQILSLQDAAAQKLLPPVETVEDDVDQPMLQDDIRKVLQRLEPREERLLKMVFGIDGPEMGTTEIAKHFGITKGGADLRVKAALRKIQRPCYSKTLKPYWGPEKAETTSPED